MKHQIDLESKIQERLDEIKVVPARNPQVAARARAHFLAQAVSADEFQRHKGWKSIFRKEQFAMNVLMSILVVAGLLFGGGVTVNAAQDDLPDEPLYAVKTWSEDLRLQFQNRPEEKVDRLMELAQIRIQEMRQLTEAGQTPPDRVGERLEQHIHQALQICSNMDEGTLDRSLLKLRDRLREQDKQLQQLQIQAAQETPPSLERTQTMLQQQLQLVEDGLLNHETFRNAARNGFNYGQTQTPLPSVTSTPLMPSGQQNGQATPQTGPNHGNESGPNVDPGGPNLDATPMPKNDGNGMNNEQGGNGSGDEESGGNGSAGDTPAGNGSGGNKP
jgi:hypothetical protein